MAVAREMELALSSYSIPRDYHPTTTLTYFSLNKSLELLLALIKVRTHLSISEPNAEAHMLAVTGRSYMDNAKVVHCALGCLAI